MNGKAVLTAEELMARAATDEAVAFTAIQVANRLSERLQDDAVREAWLDDQLSSEPAQALAPIGERALPANEAVPLAIAIIRAAAADPTLRPALDAAIREEASAKQMLGLGVLEVGVAVGLVLLIAKTEISRDVDGKWTFHLHPTSDAVLVELAKLATQALKVF